MTLAEACIERTLDEEIEGLCVLLFCNGQQNALMASQQQHQQKSWLHSEFHFCYCRAVILSHPRHSHPSCPFQKWVVSMVQFNINRNITCNNSRLSRDSNDHDDDVDLAGVDFFQKINVGNASKPRINMLFYYKATHFTVISIDTRDKHMYDTYSPMSQM